MNWFFWIGVGYATGGGTYDGGFAIPDGQEVSADAWLPLVAERPTVEVLEGPSPAGPLLVEQITGAGRATLSLAAPPDGGWLPGTHRVRATPTNGAWVDPSGLREITVEVSSEPAEAVASLQIVDVDVGAWSDEETYYTWGCCHYVRSVVFEVVHDGGPLSWSELVGEFELGRPSQITTHPPNQVMSVGVGDGTHLLVVEQWYDEETGVQPPCLTVATWSASREAGPAETMCVDDPPEGLEVEGTASTGGCSEGGCTTGRGPSWMGLAWLLLATISRRRGSPRS
jgi:hypothetical protein